MRGIDVSEHNGNIDFRKVKASGIDFVIIRAGYGKKVGQRDKYFEQNYKRAKAAGLPVGVYWYSYARDCKAVEEEARACLTVIQGKQFEFPVFFDLEEKYQVSQGKSFCDALVKTFCGAMEKAGYFTGLYMSRYYLQNCISAMVAKRYALWIAEYGYKCEYQGDYGMWQYTSNGAVSGIHGRVDRNFAYKDYPAIIKKAGLNGYGKK